MSASGTALNPMDAAWLRMEERGNPADIGALMLFQGTLPMAALRELIATRLLAHRRFRERVRESRLGIAPPRWEDEPDFSVDHHLEELTLAPGGGEGQLSALIGELLSRPLDMRRSPWRVHLVRRPGEGDALVARLHHCLGDGFALMQILLAIADHSEDGPTARPPRAGAEAPPRLATLARLAGDELRALGHVLLLPFDPPSSLRGRPGGTRRVAWSRPIPLQRVKAIGRARHETVNDVLLAALAGALRRHLLARGDAVDELTLRAVVPVNLRPPDVPVDLEHGNWFGLVFVDLPVAIPDAAGRAEAVKATLDRIKASQEPIVSLGVMAAMGRSPAVVEHVVAEVLARKGSLVATNVPGPEARLSLAGVPVEDVMFWAPHTGGLALGVSILSYAGRLRVGVRSDAAVIRDPAEIARLFEDELAVVEAERLPIG